MPSSVRWVTNQQARWASCSPGSREIRVSSRLRQCPEWVIDAVLVHELAHLQEVDHIGPVLRVGRPSPAPGRQRASSSTATRLVSGCESKSGRRRRRPGVTSSWPRPGGTLSSSAASSSPLGSSSPSDVPSVSSAASSRRSTIEECSGLLVTRSSTRWRASSAAARSGSRRA